MQIENYKQIGQTIYKKKKKKSLHIVISVSIDKNISAKVFENLIQRTRDRNRKKMYLTTRTIPVVTGVLVLIRELKNKTKPLVHHLFRKIPKIIFRGTAHILLRVPITAVFFF